jgi:glycosyltransferase involved in cell wall biosynthesis
MVAEMKPYTIIVPVFNEEEILKTNITRLIEQADRLKTPYEIIVVSNGSTDRTEELGRKLPVTFFAVPEKGVGRAFKKGLSAAQYENIIFMDADLSADLSFIEKANSLLGNNVIVLGTKINGLQNRSLFRKMGSLVFYLSVLTIMGLKYTDYAPGAKAYRKSFLEKYKDYIDDLTSFVLNLTFIASVKNEPIAEVAIACDDRRKSRFNLWLEAWSKYQGLFSLKFKQLTGKL